MTVKELNKLKVPIIRIDPKLDRFEKMNLFQDKVDEANKTLARVGLPGDKPQKTTAVNNKGKKKYAVTEAERDLYAVNEPITEYQSKKKKEEMPKKRRLAPKKRKAKA